MEATKVGKHSGPMQMSEFRLVTASFLISTLCRLPYFVEPGAGLPERIPDVCLVLSAGLCTILNGRRWRPFVLSSAAGTFAGFWIGLAMGWPKDPEAAAWFFVILGIETAFAALVSLVGGFMASFLPAVPSNVRKALWLALVAMAAFGPVGLALTPRLTAKRLANNERWAVERVVSLQRAAQRVAVANLLQPSKMCDGEVLRRNYTGRAFSEKDWQRIVGNYVKQDGYAFGIYCPRPNGGYSIHALPANSSDGTREICTDETGRLGGGVDYRQDYKCLHDGEIAQP